MSRKYWVIGAIVLLIAAGGPLFFAPRQDPQPEVAAPPLDSASMASDRFLERYVEPDGRVVRRDQGNDTVSEGQAYAMLIAAATRDRARFDSVWAWTKTNLRQPNGMLAWRWGEGRIIDPQPATDADLDAARALAVAAQRFSNEAYAEEARVLAKAIADNTLGYAADGKPVLLAGPWAKSAPFFTNPSYHSPRAEQELAELTDDTRWTAVQERERERVTALIGKGDDPVLLPPDWAQVDAAGTVRKSGPPSNPTGEALYSFDAIRLPIRLAESCSSADRAQAARMWTVLNRSPVTRTSAKMTLEGEPRTENQQTAIGAVATAGAAQAAGERAEALRMLDLADRIDADQNTYYGSAWVALGRIMLTTPWLGTC